MRQNVLDRAVAYQLGERLTTVRNRGFGIADPLRVRFDPEPDIRQGSVSHRRRWRSRRRKAMPACAP